MKTRYLFLLPLLMFGLVEPANALYKPGEKAPDFAVRHLDNKPDRLSKYKGQTLLVEFGTTWCPSCNEQAHQIDSLREFLKDSQITYLSVFLGDSPASVRKHLKEEGIKVPDQVLIDDGEARRNYAIFTIPRLLLIDKAQVVVFDEMLLSAKELKKRLKEYLTTQTGGAL